MARAFERQARGFANHELAAQKIEKWLEPRARDAPRVAVLDTSRHGIRGINDRSGHGYTVNRIVADLACTDPNDEAACAKIVVPYEALPLVKKGDTWQLETDGRGGFSGWLHNLFDAFEEALDKRAGKDLIINLSLGWDPIKTDPTGRRSRR